MNNYRNTALSSTPATIQATVGTGGLTLKGWNIINVNTSDVYVKFYDKATSPTVGTDTPILTLLVPAAASVFIEGDARSYTAFFSLGAYVAAVTGIADSSTIAPSTAIHVNFYTE